MARLWRRIFCLLALFAFLPNAVLASLPLIYCVGADGHHAIELEFAGQHSGGQHSGQGHAAAHATLLEIQEAQLGSGPVSGAACLEAERDVAPCHDYAVFSPIAGASHKAPSSEALPPPAVFIGLAARLTALLPPVGEEGLDLPLAGAAPPDRRLAERRTVVLRT